MKLDYASCSDKGAVRKQNQDAILARVCGAGGLFVVADGVGGGISGEVVSNEICDTYGKWWNEQFLHVCGKIRFADALDQIQNTLMHLNRKLVQEFGEMKAGSTLALLFLYAGHCAYVSAGDSRIYRIRPPFSCEQVTKDDAYHATDPAQAKQNGKLTSAVGIRITLEYNVRTDKIRSGESFFLCSDGIYRFADPKFLRRKLLWSGLSRPADVVDKIRREVVKNGSGDNYSCILVKAQP